MGGAEKEGKTGMRRRRSNRKEKEGIKRDEKEKK